MHRVIGVAWRKKLCCLLLVFVSLASLPAHAQLKIVLEAGQADAQLPEDLPRGTIVEEAPLSELLCALSKGADAVEVFHVQAEPLIRAEAAGRFDPRRRVWITIAVDRKKTDADITGWESLLSADVPVAIGMEEPFVEYICAAIACGLSGRYDPQTAKKYLRALHTEGLLSLNDGDAPVRITLSDRVPDGWEAVVPAEGTLYLEKGLLWRRDADAPVPLGTDVSAVSPAHALRADAEGLSAFPSVRTWLRRTVLGQRRFTTASGYEHHLAALLLIVLVAVWSLSMAMRAIPGPVRRIIVTIGCLQIGWICVRIAKYMLWGQGAVCRYLWYAFYIFQLSIPLLFVLLAHGLGKPTAAGRMRLPRWFAALCVLIGALIVLVFTNDAHQLVFTFRPDFENWNTDYGYGVGYYAVYAACLGLTVAAGGTLLVKAWRGPRRKGAVLAMLVLAGLFAYGTGYVLRIQALWESDIVLTFCLFLLLFMESASQTGLIPCNSGHRRLFTHANIGLQLLDADGATVLRTKDALTLDRQSRDAFSGCSRPIARMYDADTRLYAAPVDGGAVVWQENVRELAQLNRALEETNATLALRYQALKEEERIRGELASLRIQNQIYADVEAEAAAKLQKIQDRLRRLRHLQGEAAQREVARINMLACATKRACGLLMQSKQGMRVRADRLAMAISEMAEFCGFAGIHCTTLLELTGKVCCASAQALYDCFFTVCEAAADSVGGALLVRLYQEDDLARLMLMLEAGGLDMGAQRRISASVAAAKGSIVVKNLEDAIHLSIACPMEGDTNA